MFGNILNIIKNYLSSWCETTNLENIFGFNMVNRNFHTSLMPFIIIINRNFATKKEWVKAEQMVYHTQKYLSYIVLPGIEIPLSFSSSVCYVSVVWGWEGRTV